MTDRLGLTGDSLVTEVASNDGYLLQHFVGPRGYRCSAWSRRGTWPRRPGRGHPDGGRVPGPRPGAEIADSTAGPTWSPANNVFAHVPDIRGFAAGLRSLVKDTGLVTLEFPHLLRLIERRQYDTIYHEHYSYLSLLTASRAWPRPGCTSWTSRSWRPTAGRCASTPGPRSSAGEPTTRVKEVLDEEEAAGLHTVEGHEVRRRGAQDQERPPGLPARRRPKQGRSVAGYGAPGKGNTLLNHCGIRSDLLAYTVDRSPVKQGRYLPGTHIPIYAPERLAETRPDYILVLPWNLRDEISQQLDYVRSWGGRLVFPIPALEIV